MYFFPFAIIFLSFLYFASFFLCKEIHIAKVRIISAEKKNKLYVRDNSLVKYLNGAIICFTIC